MPGFELIGEEERRAVIEVFEHGGVLFRHGFEAQRGQSYKVREFEQAFARKLGRTHALAVSSGTAALKVGLRALGIGPGDEVITQCHTFVATVEAILECGATPVLTEIDRTLNMDPGDLAAKVTDRTKAIVPVHMLGVSARMDEIMSIARSRGIPVLEDTAQAMGGSYRGRPLGTIGDVGTFSFDHGKVLTTGEGGMVLADDERIYLRARAYHDHGHEYNAAVPRGEDTRSAPGFNYRMMELQGAVGIVQLARLDFALERQRANKTRIKDALRGHSGIRFREVPDAAGDAGDSLVVFCEDPDAARRVAADLKRRGIGFKNLPDALDWHFAGTWTHIFTTLEPYSRQRWQGLWSRSEGILRSAIAIPINIKMDEETVIRTIQTLSEAFDRVPA